MIPRIIHYCWFGGREKPWSVQLCIESWKKYLPEYEIREWNETNFNIQEIPYTYEASKVKMWAFVSDYARFWILYNYGGVYFDTDVELVSVKIRDIINRGPFMGRESRISRRVFESVFNKTLEMSGTKLVASEGLINPGLGLGGEKNDKLYKEILDFYSRHHLFTWEGKHTETVVAIVSRVLATKTIIVDDGGILNIDGHYIYPADYFCPKDYISGELRRTKNTVSIHHYSATWVTKDNAIWTKMNKRMKFFSSRLVSTLVFLIKNR